VTKGGLLDGGQTVKLCCIEESKPAAKVLGKQVGADGIREITIFILLCLMAHVYGSLWFTTSNKLIKKGRIIEYVSRSLIKLITRAHHASLWISLVHLSNFSLAGTVSVAFALAVAPFGLTKCPFVHSALFARLRSIATRVSQDVTLWAVELVLYSTQYACMIITGVAFKGTHVLALELHCT
jgi:hypothetical protein